MAAESTVRGIRIPQSRFDVDYDPFAEFAKSTGSGARNNPYAALARRRKIAPIHRLTLAEALGTENLPQDAESLAQLKAMWAIDGEVFGAYSHEAVSEILRDSERFNSSGYTRNIGLVYDHSILEMDGDEHLRHRALVNEAFHPRVLQRWATEHFGPLINGVINNFAARGEAELVRDFTFVYPVKIIAGLLGVPLEHWQWYQRCSVELITFSRLERALEVCSLLKDYFRQIIELRRAHPDGDLISELLQARIEGQRLSDEEILPFLLILTPAGTETTSRSTANILYGLFTHPEQFEAIKSDRSLIPQAIEEALRWEPPLLEINRWATRDTEVRGIKIPKGSKVVLYLGSANRDEAVWGADADEFNIYRERRQHLAFAVGRHMCLGIHLARIEMRLALNTILDRLPNLRLDPATAEHTYIDGILFRSPNQLRALFDA
jgi:cytochrome P450